MQNDAWFMSVNTSCSASHQGAAVTCHKWMTIWAGDNQAPRLGLSYQLDRRNLWSFK